MLTKPLVGYDLCIAHWRPNYTTYSLLAMFNVLNVKALAGAFNQEKALVSRSLLHDCETLIFMKVRLQL